MHGDHMHRIVDRLRHLAVAQDGVALTDTQLLECFLCRREEAAFEAIVRRHGSMVLGVCRRVLRHSQDADDAFQATFLILARKAASIRSRLPRNSASIPDSRIASVVVTAQGTGNSAVLITNDTYTGSDGKTHETAENLSLGSKADVGVGSMTKFDASGKPYTFLTVSNFPVSYAYVGRADGTVQLYGTAGEPYNGFVTAGNYAYIGGPGEYHEAQGAASVYGYSAGQSTDFAYHYSANPGSAFAVSGTAFSYLSATDTVNGVTQPYFNVGVGFTQNTGVSKNPGKDYAYIDSPGNDSFVGGTQYSFMYATNSAGTFTEFDAAYAFALVFGESFVGGVDKATNSDASKNVLNSRWNLL
jgi:hypothetical protein